jgi:hypothetical protein
MKPRQLFGKNPDDKQKVAYQKIYNKDCIVFFAQLKRKGRVAILKDERGYSVMQSIAGSFEWVYTDDFKKLQTVCNKSGYGPFEVIFWEDTKLMLELREKLIQYIL